MYIVEYINAAIEYARTHRAHADYFLAYEPTFAERVDPE